MRRAKTDNDSAGLFFELGRGKAGFFRLYRARKGTGN